MIRLASNQIPVRFEKVDSNGILPMRSTDRVLQQHFHLGPICITI